MPVPPRIVWSVEQLAVDRGDRLLEIGCGRGIAASLVGEKLGSGRLTAIDRSSKAIAAARQRNAACETAGKIVFVERALADFSAGRAAFDKVFAINVNLFWIDPHRELPIVNRLLALRGRLFLFYDPPSPEQRRKVVEQCTRNLERNGFSVEAVVEREVARSSLLAVVAKPAG